MNNHERELVDCEHGGQRTCIRGLLGGRCHNCGGWSGHPPLNRTERRARQFGHTVTTASRTGRQKVEAE